MLHFRGAGIETEVDPMPRFKIGGIGFRAAPTLGCRNWPIQVSPWERMATKRSGFTRGEKLAFAPFPHTGQWSYSHGRVWGGVGVLVVILVNQFSDDKDVSVFTP